MSDLPKGYLRCKRCTATFPQKSDEGKDVEKCPGCGLAVESIRLRTARFVGRVTKDMLVAGQGGPSKVTIALEAAIVLGSVALAVLLLRARGT